MFSITYFIIFPNVAFETVTMFGVQLMMALLPLLAFSKKIVKCFLFQSLSSRWSIVQHPWLFQQVVSQAPQHFRFLETQATCCGYFACQSVSLFISMDSSMSMYTLWNPAVLQVIFLKFLNENLDLSIHFAWWPFLTVYLNFCILYWNCSKKWDQSEAEKRRRKKRWQQQKKKEKKKKKKGTQKQINKMRKMLNKTGSEKYSFL